MDTSSSRRTFMQQAGVLAFAAGGGQFVNRDATAQKEKAVKRDYKISLAGWSLHRNIGEGDGKIPMLDMPKVSRQEFDIEAIELVSPMLASDDKAYRDQLAKNAADHNVKIILIMIDREGSVGAAEEAERNDAVKKHKHWIDIAVDFGCHSIRMNWAGTPSNSMENEKVLHDCIRRSAPPLQSLCEYGEKKDINIIIENHGGPSSYPRALTQLIKQVDHPRMGTLPDFGNFPDDVDRYDAVDLMMPYATAVSAKCYDFDDETGKDTKIDFTRMIEIVHDKHDYHGYIGIEYEGNRLSEFDGIKAAKKLLDKLRAG